MTRERKDAATKMTVDAGSASPDQVADFLRRNPDFLAENPDVLGELEIPARWSGGDGVVDMQQFMLERLRGEVENLRSCAMDLIDTSRSNMSKQTHTHDAVLALLATDDFEQLMRIIAEQLPLLLDVDVVTVGFEPPRARLPGLVWPEIQRLPEGTVRRLLGAGQDVALLREMTDDGALFGSAAGLVRSAALARMRPDGAVPGGLMALGSRLDDAFNPGQGTELIAFLARVMERRIHRCLDVAA